MPDDVRQLLMSAQASERAGDLRLAQQLLEQAADACQRGGRAARADQLRRHARRLSETLPGDGSRPFLERAAVLADAGQAAWCSFCCRPHTELGPLVAGPAGAYICTGCVERAAALLRPAARDG